MKSILIGILLMVGVIFAVKLKDDEIRKSKLLKRLVILATFSGVGFLLVGLASILIGG